MTALQVWRTKQPVWTNPSCKEFVWQLFQSNNTLTTANSNWILSLKQWLCHFFLLLLFFYCGALNDCCTVVFDNEGMCKDACILEIVVVVVANSTSTMKHCMKTKLCGCKCLKVCWNRAKVCVCVCHCIIKVPFLVFVYVCLTVRYVAVTIFYVFLFFFFLFCKVVPFIYVLLECLYQFVFLLVTVVDCWFVHGWHTLDYSALANKYLKAIVFSW